MMSSLSERQRQLQEVQRDTYRSWFTAEGRARTPLSDPRVSWQVAAVLLGGTPADRRMGTAILRHAERGPCHFRPYYAVSLLVRPGLKLPSQVRQTIERYVRASLPRAMAPDLRFHGFNDNFPAMATALLALADSYFTIKAARDHALHNLLTLRTLLRRRAWLSEFNSPTYTPITLSALAETGEYAGDKRIRDLAVEVEHRVWDDVAAHWHGPTCQPAGPFSRAYECDRVAQFTSLHLLVWLTTGNACFLQPLQSLFPPPVEQVIHHEGDLRFVQGFTASIGSAPYHPPPGLATRLWQKRLGATVTGDCEAGTYGPRPVNGTPRILYGCTENFTTTWLGTEFSMGTSRRQYLDGNQACPFFATWRRTPQPRQLADLRSCFAWYTVNGQRPGQRNESPLHHAPLDRDLVYDHGRCVTLQHESTAIVLYRPKLELAGHAVQQLALQIVVPVYSAAPPEIWIGRNRLDHPELSDSAPARVTLREGKTVAMFQPLLPPSAAGGEGSMAIKVADGYLTISLNNFVSTHARRFSEPELIHLANGFVCEMHELEAGAPTQSLLTRLRKSVAHDETVADRRSIRYTHSGLELALGWCPATESIQYATINGQHARG